MHILMQSSYDYSRYHISLISCEYNAVREVDEAKSMVKRCQISDNVLKVKNF